MKKGITRLQGIAWNAAGVARNEWAYITDVLEGNVLFNQRYITGRIQQLTF